MTHTNHHGLEMRVFLCQKGNKKQRELLLSEYKPFVLKVASKLCRRFLQWDKDDELSIALIAFNSAIDTFDQAKGVPFLAFAQTVIQNRLKDYFKSESRHNYLPLDNPKADSETELSLTEIELSLDHYQSLNNDLERRLEMEVFLQQLTDFGISLNELLASAPKHRDTRENYLDLAAKIVNHTYLINKLLRTHRLPIKEICAEFDAHPKTVERGRRYIIALCLILLNPGDYSYMSSYLDLVLSN